MKVLVVDDHPLIRSALAGVLEGLVPATVESVDITGVATVDEAAQAFAQAAPQATFDLLLIEPCLSPRQRPATPSRDGFAFICDVRRDLPQVQVVVVSASERLTDVVRAIDAGAAGFIPKRYDGDAMRAALRTVLGGGVFVPRIDANASSLREHAAEERLAPREHEAAINGMRPLLPDSAAFHLTPRQRSVLGHLMQGKSNKHIANDLGVAVETVKDHVAAVLRTLGVRSRTQAVLLVSRMPRGPGKMRRAV